METAEVFLNYHTNTSARFKPGTQTAAKYWRWFTRFCEASGADKLTKEELQARGRKLLLSFMQTIPLRSRRMALAGLETVWKTGLELGWPLDIKRDFGRTLPRTGHRETPDNGLVEPWASALAHEDDPKTKALMVCLLQYGWRPANQLGQLKWRNIKWEQGHVRAIVADGSREAFKTASGIVAFAFPNVASSLEAWHEASTATKPDDLLFPGPDGKPMDCDKVARLVKRFQRIHKLKEYVQPVLFRHWVKTTVRRAGLSEPAAAVLQGHEPANLGMQNVYDTPSQEARLAEQEQKLPNGPLGCAFDVVEVTVDPGDAELLLAWHQLNAKQITKSAFDDRLDELRLKVKMAQASFVVPR